MAKQDDDDFDFSDDALDDLPANTLQQLEHDALVSTQQAQELVTAKRNNLALLSLPTKNGVPKNQSFSNASTLASKAYPDPPSSDYGFDDEDVIDLDEQGITAQQEQQLVTPRRAVQDQEPQAWLPTRSAAALPLNRTPATTQGQDAHVAPNGVSATYKDAYEDSAYREDENPLPQNREEPKGSGFEHHADHDGLQARIEELERERAELQRSVEEARAAALSKAGEIAIVRSKHDKAAKEYERRISIMQKLHTDAVAKQKAELEAAKKDREKVETNNRFLEHDLAQEAVKKKQPRRTLTDGTGNRPKGQAQASPVTTPRKTRTLPFRDGFDDDDIVMISPVKAREKAKPETPKAGAKRKRVAAEATQHSPGQPLPLSEPSNPPTPNKVVEAVAPLETSTDTTVLSNLSLEDGRFAFLQKILTHRPYDSQERTLEVLAKHAFPSAPNKLLSSIVYDKLTFLGLSKDGEEFPKSITGVLISLWDQCLEEKYYSPLSVLTDTIQFVVDFEPIAMAGSLVDCLVPLITKTIGVVAIPIAQASVNANRPSPITSAPPAPQVPKDIDALSCLTLLHTIAVNTATSPEATNRFWQHMKCDFVLLLLNKAQPLPQITLMLEILLTGCLDTSFGAVLPEDEGGGPERQTKMEADTIDRLTSLLFDTPEPSKAGPPYTPVELAELRIFVLDVFAAACTTKHGGQALARHRYVIGRLVKFLHNSLADLYLFRTATHDATTVAVNRSTGLLHHLVTSFPELVDVRAKLQVMQGGAHMWLVALTRIAFSEQLVLEGGIQEEVVDAAHQLLDEYLSPEEGEELLRVFSSGRSAGSERVVDKEG